MADRGIITLEVWIDDDTGEVDSELTYAFDEPARKWFEAYDPIDDLWVDLRDLSPHALSAWRTRAVDAGDDELESAIDCVASGEQWIARRKVDVVDERITGP